MQWDDEERFRSLLAGVYSFYEKSLSEFGLGVWWEALRAHDFEAVRDAFSRHANNPDNGQFMPRPGDITRMLGGRTIDASQLAWTKVDHAVRMVGPYASIAFDDPIIHRVLQDMGGWTLLTTKTDEEWPFIGKEFTERYRGYVLRSERPDYPPVLVGLVEAHNGQIGGPIPAPVLIGNAELARRVVAGGSDRPVLTVVAAAGERLLSCL
jgi:hypothetical protein